MRSVRAPRTTRRWAVALGAIGLLTTCLGTAVVAAPRNGRGTPSITEIHVDRGRVTAVLTLPAGPANGSVDPGSVRIRFGTRAAVRASVAALDNEPRSALVLIDTSGSMARGGLSAAQSAASDFLDQVPDDVRVGLESFADHPRVLVTPTTDRTAVRSALGSLHAGGATALYDALKSGARELGTRGSRTIVLLSDGADTQSRVDLHRALAALGANGVRLAVVGFHTSQTQDDVLARISSAGHGTLTEALDPRSLQRAFGAAAREIATQARLSAPVPVGARGSQQVTVTGTRNGRPFQVEFSVALPVTGAATGAATTAAHGSGAPTVTAGPATSRLLWVAAAAVFAGLLALVLALAAAQFTPAARRRIRGLEQYLHTGTNSTTRKDRVPSLRGLSEGLTRAADAYISWRPSAARTGLVLERADLPLRLEEWYVLRVLAVPISAAVCWLLLADSGARVVLTLIGTVVVGGVMPALVLRHLASRRAHRFEQQLPDVLTLIASSLSTGFSLAQALDGITRDAAEPAAKEFSRALAETRIGVDLEDALDHVADRMASVSLAWATMAVRIQRRVGGNLAEVMRTTAKTLRDRETLRRQVRALTAEGRLSAYILLVLPVVMGVYLYVANRTYLSLLWQRSLGVFMLAISGVLLVIGVFWMRRVANVKV